MSITGTSDINAYTFHLNGVNVSLVDTPGFNDTHRSETEVLQNIAAWLQGNYESNTRLSGIVYLHSLMNVRMEGSALRNLKMFRQLCGNEPLKNVILATSFWGDVPQQDALRREEQLRSTPDFWGDMLDRGSTMQRLVDRNSALRIIELLVQKPKVTLKIQHELVEDRKSLVDTAAGQEVNEELMRLQEKHKEELERVQKELREAMEERDQEMQLILEQQQRKLDKHIDAVKQQQDMLLYDRRAERRNLENEYQSRLNEKLEELEQRNKEKMQELNFDQAVSMIRVNEGKLPAEERDRLEAKIAELSKELAESTRANKPGDVSARKKRGSSRYLFAALKVILPITSMALIGVPIFSPFGSGASAGGFRETLFGGGMSGSAEEPQV